MVWETVIKIYQIISYHKSHICWVFCMHTQWSRMKEKHNLYIQKHFKNHYCGTKFTEFIHASLSAYVSLLFLIQPFSYCTNFFISVPQMYMFSYITFVKVPFLFPSELQHTTAALTLQTRHIVKKILIGIVPLHPQAYVVTLYLCR